MTKPRRSFTDAFEREAGALLHSSGRPLMQIAEELGIQPSMLRNWRNAAGVPAGASRRPDPQATARQAGSPADQSAEIARLRRDVERLRMERDTLRKLAPSSRSRRNEVPLHRRSPRCLAGAGAVRSTGGLGRRPPCVARSTGKCQGGGEPGPPRRRPAHPRAAPSSLWCAAHPRRLAGGRSPGQPRPYRAIDATARHPRGDTPPLSGAHHRQQPWPAGRRQSPWSDPSRHPAACRLAGRHPLHPDRRGLAGPRRRPRPVQPQGGGMGDARSPASGAVDRRADHGDPAAAARSWTDPPLRSRRSACRRRLPRVAGSERHRAVDEPGALAGTMRRWKAGSTP